MFRLIFLPFMLFGGGLRLLFGMTALFLVLLPVVLIAWGVVALGPSVGQSLIGLTRHTPVEYYGRTAGQSLVDAARAARALWEEKVPETAEIDTPRI